MSNAVAGFCGVETRRPGTPGVLLLAGLLLACGASGPQEIDPASDACSRCRMSIDQLAHAGEIITTDGSIRKYDSLGCLVRDYREAVASGRPPRATWVLDYGTRHWLRAEDAYFALAALPTDHMGYGVAATRSRKAALKLAGGVGEKVVRWPDLPPLAAMETAGPR